MNQLSALQFVGRRETLAILAGAAAAFVGARATAAGKVPLVAFLSSRAPEESADMVSAFQQGLRAFGIIDFVNCRIEWRWARGDYAALPALARELLALSPNVVAAVGGGPSPRAVLTESSTVPVVFLTSDVTRTGLVDNINRPNGNATGVDIMSGSLTAKRFELLAELLPQAKKIGVLLNPLNDYSDLIAGLVEPAARARGVELTTAPAAVIEELPAALDSLVADGAAGVVVVPDAMLDAARERVVAAFAQRRLPAIFHIREFPVSGGLISYGASLADGYYQVGQQVGRLLRGARVSNLPVLRPTKFELVINLPAARSLGIVVPPALLAQLDETIDQ
jgi:putative ABC transport system substrate-binding protein